MGSNKVRMQLSSPWKSKLQRLFFNNEIMIFSLCYFKYIIFINVCVFLFNPDTPSAAHIEQDLHIFNMNVLGQYK